MDFNDTPEEAAFRTEARTWLEANAQPLGPDDEGRNMGELLTPEIVSTAQAWQKKKGRSRLGLHYMAQGAWRALRNTHGKRNLERGAIQLQAA